MSTLVEDLKSGRKVTTEHLIRPRISVQVIGNSTTLRMGSDSRLLMTDTLDSLIDLLVKAREVAEISNPPKE